MEKLLNELIEKLKATAGDNLKSVVLYGSAAGGEYHAKHSDLNVLCLVERAGAAELELLGPVAQWWTRKGHPAPLVFTLEELRRSADVFAIELLDIQERHRILFGDDFLGALDVPMTLHRLQVERELRTNWLRFREAILATPPKNAARLGLMTKSISSFTALFRHALIALGEAVPDSKRAVIDHIARLVGSNASAFHTILDVREGKQKESQVDVTATVRAYLELVERVTDEVDRRLAGET
jgi:predicted nucleotidyltransferase